jgi:hypothetical protein
VKAVVNVWQNADHPCVTAEIIMIYDEELEGLGDDPEVEWTLRKCSAAALELIP